MSTSNQPSDDKLFVTRALEASITIGLVGLVLFWCFKISQPFIGTIVWGIIGLFVGAIILALGYKIFLAWLNDDALPQQASGKSD